MKFHSSTFCQALELCTCFPVRLREGARRDVLLRRRIERRAGGFPRRSRRGPVHANPSLWRCPPHRVPRRHDGHQHPRRDRHASTPEGYVLRFSRPKDMCFACRAPRDLCFDCRALRNLCFDCRALRDLCFLCRTLSVRPLAKGRSQEQLLSPFFSHTTVVVASSSIINYNSSSKK